MKLACKAVDCVWENLNETISNAKRQKSPPEIKGERDSAELKFWLENTLKMSFIWWPDYNLFALAGDIWPEDVKALFDKEIVFNNTGSQSYEFDTWDGVCDLFDEVVCMAKISGRETLGKILKTEGEWPEEEDLYWRKVAAYKQIFEALGLWQWLYGQETEKFYRFSMSALTSLGRTIAARNSLIVR